MFRWQRTDRTCLVAMAVVTMVTALGVAGCPTVCQCTQKYYVYCSGIGLTSDRLQEVMVSVSPEALFLDLSSNSIERLIPGALNSLPNLEYLVLADNHIQTIGVSVFHYLQRIKELNLTQNRLTEVSVNVFVNMPNLQRLHLAGNEIEMIKEQAFNLPGLEQLFLQDNRLTAVRPTQLAGLGSLEYLDLSRNMIHSLEVGAFQDLPALQVLRLSQNRLASLAEHVFQGLTSLRKLYLDGNVLPSLDCFDVPNFASTLQVLVLSNNSLGAIPQDVFPKLQNLKTLALDHNHISIIGQHAFDDLELDILTLTHNHLEVIDREMFNGIRRISAFDLSHNRIHTLKTGAFDRFRESVYVLDLAGNRLSAVHHGMFRVMKNLLEMNLSGNALQSIRDGTFQELTSLARLDLDHNELQSLSANLLRGPSFQRLSVRENPLKTLEGFAFNESDGPVSVYVNLTILSTTETSATVTWPFEGTNLYWTVQVKCLGGREESSGAGGGSCEPVIREQNIAPYRTSETVSGLQPDSRYYVCVLPKFLAQNVLVSQCGVLTTASRPQPTVKPSVPGGHVSSGGLAQTVQKRNAVVISWTFALVLLCLSWTRFVVRSSCAFAGVDHVT